MKSDKGETAAYLLALAEQNNWPLTASQLRRLHLEGLIERPIQEHPEGRIGSETIYPKGTGEVLLAICSRHHQKRSFSALAWQLWWDGYSIPLTRVRVDLQKTREGWERLQCRLSRPGMKGLSRFAWRVLEKMVAHRFRDAFPNQARKRVGAVSFDTFLRILLEIAVGNFQGYADDHAGSREEEQQIMVKGFDLRRTEIDRARDIDWTVNLESSLVELSEIIKQGSWTQWLDQADEAELVCNRDELRLLLTTFESLSEAMEVMAS